VAGIMITALLLAELAAAAVEPHLPAPQLWPTTQAAAKAAQISNLAPIESIDVVFLGSSVVVQGVDPIAFNNASEGLTGYNAALDGASMRSVELWAREVVFPAFDPGIVVIGVTTRDLNDGGVNQEEFFRGLEASKGLQGFRSDGGLSELLERLADSSALLRIRPHLRQPGKLAEQLLGRDDESDQPPGPYGAAESQGSLGYQYSDAWRDLWRNRHFNDYAIGQSEWEALQRIVGAAEDEGRQVIVVEMPVHDDYLDLQPDGEAGLSNAHALLAEIESRPLVELVSLTDVFQPEFFRDPAHLNEAGAELLGIALADHLSDPSVPFALVDGSGAEDPAS
jgi:hypothetical protein